MWLPKFENFTLYACLMDLFYASLFLFVAQILRKKLKILQNLYIPASLLAGILAMICGKEFTGIVPFSGQAGTYSSVLIIPLFACIGLGYKEKKASLKETISRSRDSFFSFCHSELYQYGLFIVIGALLCKYFFKDLNPAAGYLLPSGFNGGHGTATSIGALMEAEGFEGAQGIGLTFATVGLLFGIIGGVISINIAIRKKSTKFVKTLAETPEEMRTGWVPKDKRESIGEGTMSSASIDPLGWHIVVICVVSGLGYMMNLWFTKWTHFNIPALTWALVFGYLMQFILNKCGIGDYVNRKVVTRISGTVTDYLVFFAFQTIRKDIIAENWAFLVIMCVLAMLFTLFYLWVLGPMCFNSNWFERSIYMFGMYTGVAATGYTLLRIVDPEGESRAFEEYGLTIISTVALNPIIIASLPAVAARNGGASALGIGLGILGAGVVVTILAIIFKAFHGYNKDYYDWEKYEAAMKEKGVYPKE